MGTVKHVLVCGMCHAAMHRAGSLVSTVIVEISFCFVEC